MCMSFVAAGIVWVGMGGMGGRKEGEPPSPFPPALHCFAVAVKGVHMGIGGGGGGGAGESEFTLSLHHPSPP
jgi:hypothetical protein